MLKEEYELDSSENITEADIKDVISNYSIYSDELSKSLISLWNTLLDKKTMIETCRESAALYRNLPKEISVYNENFDSYDSAETVRKAEKKYMECINDLRSAIETNLNISKRNDKIWSCYNALPLKYKHVLGRLYENRNSNVETWSAACDELAAELGCSISKIKAMQKKGIEIVINEYKKRI